MQDYVEYFPLVPPDLLPKFHPALYPRRWTFIESIKSFPHSLASMKAQPMTGSSRSVGRKRIKVGITLAPSLPSCHRLAAPLLQRPPPFKKPLPSPGSGTHSHPLDLVTAPHLCLLWGPESLLVRFL